MVVAYGSDPILEDLSVTEYAYLSLTNPFRPSNEENSRFGCVLYTDKLSYVWAGLIAELVVDDYQGGNLERIYPKIGKAVVKLQKEYSPDNLWDNKPRQSLYVSLDRAFFGESGIPSRHRISAAQFARITRDIPRGLEKRGLIVDPFFETIGGSAAVLLGLIPHSFTKRTEEGDAIYLRVSALLWDYERVRDKKNSKIELHFRVNRLVAFLKEFVQRHFGPTSVNTELSSGAVKSAGSPASPKRPTRWTTRSIRSGSRAKV